MSLFLDATLAFTPPAAGTPGYERVTGASGVAAPYSTRLTRDKGITIMTGAAPCRIRFTNDRADVATSTDFRLPPNAVITFRNVPDKVYLNFIGDGAVTYEAFVWPSDR